MSKRDRFSMVNEDDPQFCRFWDAYPKRVAKKDARKAWAKLRPSVQLVDVMIAALGWQVPAYQWDGAKFDYALYPASWLNGERWKDERRKVARPVVTEAAEPSWLADYCFHQPCCETTEVCRAKRAQEAKAQAT